jgi:molybdopterin molybdotransferase
VAVQVPSTVDARPGKPNGLIIDRPLAWSDARRLAFDCATPISPGPIPLGDAIGRVLAVDVTALQSLPHYASSAMDGWAVNAGGPWAVTEPGQHLDPGSAAPIVTGGVIPPGAQAVLRLESGQLTTGPHGQPLLVLRADASAGEPRIGQHIRRSGSEAAAGETLIAAGTALNPAHIALAAVAGLDQLEVLGKPHVEMLLTGSEVVSSGIPLPGQVRDTFGPQLGAVIRLLGGIPGAQHRVGDSFDEWLAALEASGIESRQGADVVVTTGGTGRSASDHFRRAIAALGGQLLIDGIAMRPGHPAVLAKLPNGRFVVGLPGNPLAALMALFTIGSPLLAALGHRPLDEINRVPCGTAIDAHTAPTRLMPFRILDGMALPVQHTGPGMMRGLAAADGVMVVPSRGVQPGEPVPSFTLPWRPELPSLPVDRSIGAAPWHA